MTTPVDDAPPHLLAFLDQHGIEAEFIAPGVPMPTVPAAAEAIGVPTNHILKTLLFADSNGGFVVAIANGTRRVDRNLLGKVCGLSSLRAASPDAVLEQTGYPAGGVAPVGLKPSVPVVVDTSVLALPIAFGGGGVEHLLLQLRPDDIIRCNQAIVAKIVSGD
jgi:Cys-tRNA(Pro)/Cys-tRNA(Cys) deacylase